jgi:hypothetical protein
MAMPKKGSRSLVVDGRKYRWSVKCMEDDTGRNEYGMDTTLTIAVEHYENPQSMLCIHHQCGFKYASPTGSAEARPRSLTTGQVMEITPHQVAALIRKALEQGWNPEAKAEKFFLTL